MENQQPAGEVQNSQKPFYKKWWGVIIIILFLPFFAIWYVWAKTKWNAFVKGLATLGIILITFIALGSGGSENNNSNNAGSSQQSQQQTSNTASQETNSDQSAQVTETPAQNNTPAQPTDQPSLEKSLTDLIGKSSGMSYKNMEVDKSDSTRPKDTQFINVGVNVESFLNKDFLLKQTGSLSARIFQAVYNVPAMKAYDITVSYYGGTTDRYGNKSSSVVLTYSMDKSTFGKINWQNFDPTTLCDFLNQEAVKTGTVFNTSCNVLVNIQ